MKIRDIVTEDAEAGTTMAGNIASVTFPLFGDKKIIEIAEKIYIPKGKLIPKAIPSLVM